MPAFARTGAVALLVASSDAVRVSRHTASDPYTPYERKSLLVMTPCKAQEVEDLNAAVEAARCKIIDHEMELPKDGGCAETMVVCEPEDAKQVEADFPGRVTSVSSDAAAHLRKTSGVTQPFVARAGDEMSSAFYSSWRGLADRMQRVEDAVRASGGVAQMEVAGQSHDGRDMMLVRFRGAGYSPGGPRAVLTFNLHAREWIGGMAGVYAVEKFCDRVKNDPSIIAGMEVVMVPMANPDGFYHSETRERFHRKNTNGIENAGWFCTGGVDLNRNFDSNWATAGSSSNRCSDVYHGPSVESEKETQVLRDVILESPTTVMVDVHAFGNYILWSWGFTRENHPRQREFQDLGDKMERAMTNTHGQEYTIGPIAQVLYAAAGGIEDYATTTGALGYCYELRPRSAFGQSGFAPAPDQILPTAEECYDGLLVAIEHTKQTR